MALAQVQHGNSGSIASGLAGTVLPVAAALGNCVAIALGTTSLAATPILTVTSPMGVFNRVNSGSISQNDKEWWICTDVTGSGTSITVTTASGGNWTAEGIEVSGGVSVANDGGYATGVSTAPSLTVANPVAGEMVLVAAQELSGTFTASPGAPWTTIVVGVTDQIAYQTTVAVGVTATWTLNASHQWQALGLILSHEAPAAPTLTSPTNASYQDVVSGLPFSAIYNAAGSDNMGAYALRVKVAGGAYNYWNAGGSSLQSTIVWNALTVVPGAAFGPTLPNTAIFDANTYNWSIACQDAPFGGRGPFAADFTFVAQAIPTLTVTAPSGTVGTTTQPTVQWVATFPALAAQVGYQIIVESGAFGSVPGSGTQAWTSGFVTSAAVSAQIGVPLISGTTYRVFVQVSETGGQTSAWAFSSFTISVDVPAQPVITATPGTDPVTGVPIVILTVQGNDNYMSANDSSFEGGGTGSVGTWTAGPNTTIAASSTVARDGTWSLKLTPTAAGTISAVSGKYPVTALTQSSLQSFVRAGLSARAVTFSVNWFNGVTLLSNSVLSSLNDSTSSWSQYFGQPTAPAGANLMQLSISIAATSGSTDVHFVDQAAMSPVTEFNWSLGGFVGLTTIVITRSDNTFVRWASLANPLPVPSVGQLATVYDYEITPGVQYSYSAVVQVASIPLTSLSGTSGNVTVNTTGWWEFDPTAGTATTNPSVVNAQMVAWTPVQTEQATANPVLNQATMNVAANAMMNQDFSGTVETFSVTAYVGFNQLLTSQKPVFISSPWGALDTGYFRIGPQTGGQSGSSGTTAKTTTLMPSTASAPHRTVSITAVAQQRPPV